jgi:hypothetical protein
LWTQYVYVFRMIFRINGDYFPTQHYPIGIMIEVIMCCLWSRNRNFIYYLEQRTLLAARVMLDSCLGCPSTLKLRATYSSQMSVEFRLAIGRYIPEDRTLQITTLLPTFRMRDALRPRRLYLHLHHIVTWRLKAGIVKPEQTSIARQRLCKHIPRQKIRKQQSENCHFFATAR